MIDFIDKLKEILCNHDYELVDESDIYSREILYPYNKVLIGKEWTYICKKCKHVKVVRNCV